MKFDLEVILATLGLQTATGVLFGNWAVGGCAVLGFFAGMALNRAPAYMRNLTLPALLAIILAYAGPKVFT